jgi:xanthine dehydrogenase YagS FAD-binding subunit
MKAFANHSARDLRDAVRLLQQAERNAESAIVAGGGSDLLSMVKDRLVNPGVLVHLKGIRSLGNVRASRRPVREVRVGGLISLDTLSRNPLIRDRYTVLAQAAEQVGTPQIRNAATLAGNICQRPWCWYFRNGFPCHKNGGHTCFSENGENQFHAIFGGGPSFIVHPSDTAPALVALEAKFRIFGPLGDRTVAADEFFSLPSTDVARENVLGRSEILAEIILPNPETSLRSTYHKVMDREVWTHAVVSVALVLEMDQRICKRARVVLGGVAPIPWRLPRVETMLAGETITSELAAEAGKLAVDGARPLAQNAYKVPLVSTVLRRTILTLASR